MCTLKKAANQIDIYMKHISLGFTLKIYLVNAHITPTLYPFIYKYI